MQVFEGRGERLKAAVDQECFEAQFDARLLADTISGGTRYLEFRGKLIGFFLLPHERVDLSLGEGIDLLHKIAYPEAVD